ncbi:MAG TPA: DUF2254 domain-containing protein [Pyrinomonadaceae bacterium]|nr:DUF2254 domain-containing protein [Pyrinomonadaceae bacterium]
MNWLLRYRARIYFRNSMWIFPAIGIVLGWAVVPFLVRFELSMGWQLQIGRDNTLAVIGTIAATTINLVVVVSSALLLAVQLASAQLTPRIIVLIYRNTPRKILLAIFAFTFTFSVSFLVRVGDSIPPATAYLAAFAFLLNLVLFIYFIDNIGKSLRPVAALRAVALAGREVVHDVYPRRLDQTQIESRQPLGFDGQEPKHTVISRGDGAVLAFDAPGLVSLAERSDCLIELVPKVGDFVAEGDPLFRVFSNGDGPSEDALRNSVALDQERTLEQDPMFAFRIIVDVASKALSPAINDPTTAVLAIDQIHHLLRDVGSRDLSEDRESDAKGRVRLVYRTPDWEDFVQLATTEIRQYGRDSIQIIRRLRAMLENLIETLPERRRPALLRELSLVDAVAKRAFPDADDQTLAQGSDSQGMGGSDNEDGSVLAAWR